MPTCTLLLDNRLDIKGVLRHCEDIADILGIPYAKG